MRRIVLVVMVVIALGACRQHESRRASFVGSLRCGMTKADVTWLAHERGYDDADASWLTRSERQPAKKSKELELLDLSFHAGRLVAYREGNYDPRTRRTSYRTVDLCGPASEDPALHGTR